MRICFIGRKTNWCIGSHAYILSNIFGLGVFSVFFWSSSRYPNYHEHLRENALRTGLKCSVVLDNYLTSQGGTERTFFKNKALSCLEQIGFPQDELAYRQLKGGQASILIEDLQNR